MSENLLKDMNKKIILLRGLAGSGKSTYAQKLKEKGALIFSNDELLTAEGVYKWDEELAVLAHYTNQKMVCQAMREGKEFIVIDNTNIHLYNMTPYIRLAHYYKYEYELFEMDTPWALDIEELEKKNTHNVPLSILDEMRKQYLDVPKPTIECLFRFETAMDPEISLRLAQCEIEKGRFATADEAIIDYEDWRRISGYEPDGGDDTAKSINNKLESWRLDKGICCGQ